MLLLVVVEEVGEGIMEEVLLVDLQLLRLRLQVLGLKLNRFIFLMNLLVSDSFSFSS